MYYIKKSLKCQQLIEFFSQLAVAFNINVTTTLNYRMNLLLKTKSQNDKYLLQKAFNLISISHISISIICKYYIAFMTEFYL